MKPLPIGIDDFEKVRRGEYYYVDKTLMVRDFLEMKDEGGPHRPSQAIWKDSEHDDAPRFL